MNPQAFFEGIGSNLFYWAALGFFAFYPVVSSITWITTSLNYFYRWERRRKNQPPELDHAPPVTVLIPAYGEESVIHDTLSWATRIDYPDYEVVVIDDCSKDGTRSIVMPFVQAGLVRLIRKNRNEGKAMALNDALPCLRGEIVLVLDADACPDPGILRWMVPHFRSARVAAVTGNPRVANRDTFLSKLQVIEFTSIVSILRRAQRVWGRILTMSGVVGAFRKSALYDAGLYSPEMATEDIDMTWKLQRAFYDVRYEPRAIVWMKVPGDLKGLWQQRRRWALGLAQVLRRHSGVLKSWKERRMWPVYIEAVLSILWAYCFVLLTLFWIASYAMGVPPIGASPIPNWWGMMIATMCLAQLLTGALLDSRYDRSVMRSYPVAVVYPIVYWMLMSLTTAVATPSGFFGRLRPGQVTRWRTIR